jgi:hypothetical protein
MTDAVANTPLPLRLSVTNLIALIGLHKSTHAYSILASLRRQNNPKTEEPIVQNNAKIEEPIVQKTSNKFVDHDVYWALVGLIKDNYVQTYEQHIEAIKEYLNEEHTQFWYSKLYKCLCSTVGTMIHEEMSEGQPKASLTLQLTPTVLLVGKPDIVEDDRVIELKTRKEFVESIPEREKVQLFCYLKLTNLKKGVLREVVGTETKDTDYEWDEDYWKKIERTTLAMLEWF